MIKHIDIEPGEGRHAFINCKLGREEYADSLTRIIYNYSDGFVLAVNNEWGAGKSTFIKMWREKLDFLNFPTLYYNAWENDFERDVLVALISELEELKEPNTKVIYNSVLRKAALLSKKIGPGILKTFLKKHTGIESEELGKIWEGVAEVGLEAMEAEILSYSKRKDTLKDFRMCLQAFVKKAAPDKPVVFFIDELDRCRPNYAVEVLEQIKHLFSVAGIVFVLSVDKEQLGHAVRGVYGSEGINAEEYLRRFIDLEFSLPQPEPNQAVEYLFNYFEFENYFNYRPSQFTNDGRDFNLFASKFIEFTGLAFRQQIKLFSQTKLTLSTFGEDSESYPLALLHLIYLRNFDPLLYLDIKEKKLSSQELIFRLEEIGPRNIQNEDDLKIFFTSILIIAALYNNAIKSKIGLLTRTGPDTDEIHFTSKKWPGGNQRGLKELMIGLENRYWIGKTSIDAILKKIELLQNFK